MDEKDALLSVFLEFFKKHENKRRRIHILEFVQSKNLHTCSFVLVLSKLFFRTILNL